VTPLGYDAVFAPPYGELQSNTVVVALGSQAALLRIPLSYEPLPGMDEFIVANTG
jgi:hypothetical protein